MTGQQLAALQRRLIDAGLTVEAAQRATRHDGRLAPGVHVVIDAPAPPLLLMVVADDRNHVWMRDVWEQS